MNNGNLIIVPTSNQTTIKVYFFFCNVYLPSTHLGADLIELVFLNFSSTRCLHIYSNSCFFPDEAAVSKKKINVLAFFS